MSVGGSVLHERFQGKINPTPRSVETLRICKGKDSEEIHSYPYRVLSSWHLKRVSEDDQELKIEAGPDVLTILDRGLIRIAAALDSSCVEMIVEQGEEPTKGEEEKIVVSKIILETASRTVCE